MTWLLQVFSASACLMSVRGTPSLFFFPAGPGVRRRRLDGGRVVRALEDNAIDELVLFLSHSDQDHVEGVQYVLQNFGGRFLALLYNRDRLNARPRSSYVKLLRTLAEATRDQATRNEDVWSGDFNSGLNFDIRFPELIPSPVSLEVLHPTHDEQGNLLGTSTNEASGVLRLVYTFGRERSARSS